jgi:hypothetical protein
MKSSDFYYKNRPLPTLQRVKKPSAMSISQMFAVAVRYITAVTGRLVAPKMGIF